jgi:hypothetical protein
MSVLELIGSILTELEEVQEKLDRLLASGGEKESLNEREGLAYDQDNLPLRDDSKLPEVRIHSPGFEDYKPEPKKDLALPMTGKYQWYNLVNHEGKVRKCVNEGCDLFLLWNKDKKKYEHWKYDVNTGKGGYVADKCEGVYNG